LKSHCHSGFCPFTLLASSFYQSAKLSVSTQYNPVPPVLHNTTCKAAEGSMPKQINAQHNPVPPSNGKILTFICQKLMGMPVYDVQLQYPNEYYYPR